MRQCMLVILQFCLICCSWALDYDGGSPERTINDCMKDSDCGRITVTGCSDKHTMNYPKCTMDISGVSQKTFSKLRDSMLSRNLALLNEDPTKVWEAVLEPWIMCNGSSWSEVNFTKIAVGHIVLKPENDGKKDKTWGIELDDYPKPALTLVNNFNLRNVILDLGELYPKILKIGNNPRLSRLSIDNLSSQVRDIPDKKADIQPYGACDFHTYMNPLKDSLTWEEFRWCRNVLHNVVLDGSQFNSTIVDAAYVLEIKGMLTIRNTQLTDLRMLPVYFKISNGVISNNKDLCLSFEDEIRMKRLGFTMENNKPLNCRTICQGGKLTLEDIKSRKNCITIEGGLVLDNIDESAAAADLFRTVKKIEGPLIISNAKVPVVFKKLTTIGGAVKKREPHIVIQNCKHPIVFNKLVELVGDDTSRNMVLLEGGKTNIFKHLKAKYPGKVYDSARDQSKSTTVTTKSVTSVKLPIAAKIEPPRGTTATPVAMPVATKTENNMAIAESIKPASVERSSSRLPSSTYPRPGPNAAEISDVNSSRGDVNNSSVDEKKTVLVVMTCVSFFIFLASSVTSIGIFLKYRLM